MACSGSHREKYLLTVGIRVLDVRYAALPLPGRVLQLIMTNLRNRPVSSANVDSMRDSVLSLYHNLITGSRDFPLIPYKGSFRTRQVHTPFDQVQPEQKENAAPSPLMERPSGMMTPAAGSRSSPPTILTPVLPERTDLGALRADRRNLVQRVEINGTAVTRVISPVYDSESGQLSNRWRVTDYRADGHVIMSVLCRFTKESAECAKTKRQGKKRKKKDAEKGLSRLSPPKKQPRL